MGRFLLSLLIVALVMGLAAPAVAQGPAQPPGNPAQPAAPQPGAAPGQPGTEAAQRHTTIEFVAAFAGVALVLVVVCYPSRRY